MPFFLHTKTRFDTLTGRHVQRIKPPMHLPVPAVQPTSPARNTPPVPRRPQLNVHLSAGVFPSRTQSALWAHHSTEVLGDEVLGCSLETIWQRMRSRERTQVDVSVKNGRWRVGEPKNDVYPRAKPSAGGEPAKIPSVGREGAGHRRRGTSTGGGAAWR